MGMLRMAAAVAIMSALAPAAGAQTSKLDPDMQKVLDAHNALEPKPIESLNPSEARRQPTPADGVKKVIKDENRKVDPHAGLSVSNRYFADMGNLRLRYYTPDQVKSDSNVPVIVYFRGGGWVIADLDVYDATPAALARKTGAIVVSVDYPTAPEKKFPAAHDEAIDAYKYILRNAKSWGGDPARISIVGESAGGNLAVNTAIAARDQGLQRPVGVVAIYPLATTSMHIPSRKEHAQAKPLNTPMLTWFLGHVLENDNQKQDPRLDLVNANLKDLPPVTIIAAEVDPLRSDADLLSEKLKTVGNETVLKVYPGVTHEFFGMDAVVAKAAEAQDFAVQQLKKTSEQKATEGTGPRQ